MNQREGYVNFTLVNNRTDTWAIGLKKSLNKLKLLEFILLIDKFEPLGRKKSEILSHIDIQLPKPLLQMPQAYLLFNCINNEVEQQTIQRLERKSPVEMLEQSGMFATFRYQPKKAVSQLQEAESDYKKESSFLFGTGFQP